MQQLDVRLMAYISSWRGVLAQRWKEERGEGVISTALAVLIVAFLGLAAYKLFDSLIASSGEKAQTQVNSYGGK